MNNSLSTRVLRTSSSSSLSTRVLWTSSSSSLSTRVLWTSSSLIRTLLSPVTWLIVMVIRGYQRFISPMTPPVCRFTPSCSHYTLQAVQIHGPVYGGFLGVHRICRCHPWNPGGYDPVPPAIDVSESHTDAPFLALQGEV